MSRTVVIHQPDFAPYLGFFHRFLQADLWIVLDHVDFAPRNWTHRDKIKTASGPQWLSQSVRKAPRGTAIADITLADDPPWRRAHLDALRTAYRGAAQFGAAFDGIEALYANPEANMARFNLAVIDWACAALETPIPRVLSSSLTARTSKSALMADLVAEVGGTRYLSGQGARAYLQAEPFAARGLELVWQDFTHPTYPQLHGGFEPYLSVFDLILNVGAAGARDLVRRC